MSEEKKLMYNVKAETMEEFRELALQAKASGATHVYVSDLPRSWWMWARDFKDPYPNWCMGHAQIFKLVCPPELEDYLPVDFIHECFALVKERCDILKEIGLKPAMHSNEPFWLPEQVYRDHPSWRGARCDHPRRATKPYYSPCVDNPEVLGMYRRAVCELVKATGIDYISFMSNDSGGGLCWSNGTYVGPNGPECCRTRSMSDRVCGFVNAITDGAAEAGVQITVSFNANIGFKEEEIGANVAWHSARDHQIINGRDNKGRRPVAMLNRHGDWIHGIPDIFQLAQSLGGALDENKRYISLYLGKDDFNEDWEYLKVAAGKEAHSWLDYLENVHSVAAHLVGDALADQLTDAFYYIYEGEQHFSHDGLGLIMYGCYHQRWINRPFVLFPEELAEEDRSYYRRFQFQALDEAHANDLMDMQNIECARGFSAAFLLSETSKKAIASFNKAIGKLDEIIGATADESVKAKCEMLIRRLKVYQSLMKTCANAAAFQDLKDRTDFDYVPPLECRWPTRNDPRIEQFQNITRAEIDNAYELADLIEGYEKQLFNVTDEEHEDIFTFGPHLAAQIRRKAEIMLDRQLDANRVYERHNI